MIVDDNFVENFVMNAGQIKSICDMLYDNMTKAVAEGRHVEVNVSWGSNKKERDDGWDVEATGEMDVSVKIRNQPPATDAHVCP